MNKLRIVFQNVFADIDANNIIALCSCLVFDEKSEDPITNNLDLMKAFETCKGIARNVAEIMVGDTQFVEIVAVALEIVLGRLMIFRRESKVLRRSRSTLLSLPVSQLEVFSLCVAFELPELIRRKNKLLHACFFKCVFHSLDVSSVIGGEAKKTTP